MDFLINNIFFLSTFFSLAGLDKPKITEHPLDVMVPRYEPVTLNCKAEGIPTPTITWYKDGEALKVESGLHRMILPAGGLFFLKVSTFRFLNLWFESPTSRMTFISCALFHSSSFICIHKCNCTTCYSWYSCPFATFISLYHNDKVENSMFQWK